LEAILADEGFDGDLAGADARLRTGFQQRGRLCWRAHVYTSI
jgi:hypothetical protein